VLAQLSALRCRSPEPVRLAGKDRTPPLALIGSAEAERSRRRRGNLDTMRRHLFGKRCSRTARIFLETEAVPLKIGCRAVDSAAAYQCRVEFNNRPDWMPP
jgi:hypothetical protein